MYTAKVDIAVNQPPAVVWALVGPFASLAEWHPEVTSCEASENDKGQKLRTVTFTNGQVVVECLTKHSDATFSYVYTLDKGKLPVRDFRGELQVIGTDTESLLRWTATFDVIEGIPVERAVGIVQSIFDGARPGLEAKLGRA